MWRLLSLPDGVSIKFSVGHFELAMNNTQAARSIKDGGGWHGKALPMFCTPIVDLSGHMETMDYFNLTLKVRTLELVDIRPMSANTAQKYWEKTQSAKIGWIMGCLPLAFCV